MSGMPADHSPEAPVSWSEAGRTDTRLSDWIEVAKAAFEAQLVEAAALSHRQLSAALADWVGMSASERAAIGTALDLLQVAFDVADNLADAEEDERRGKARVAQYREIPHAVRFCLPAYLVGASLECIQRNFAHRAVAAARANADVLRLLGEMAVGQSVEEPLERARLVSGAQARLICLPLRLGAPSSLPPQETLAAVEAWAEAWGTSWELGYRYRDLRTNAARRDWLVSLKRARARWPQTGPFAPGQPLSIELRMPGLC
jgi:hypothetical protein